MGLHPPQPTGGPLGTPFRHFLPAWTFSAPSPQLVETPKGRDSVSELLAILGDRQGQPQGTTSGYAHQGRPEDGGHCWFMDCVESQKVIWGPQQQMIVRGEPESVQILSTGPANPTHSPATNVTNLLRLTARPQGRETDSRCSSSEQRPRSASGSSPPGPSPLVVLRPPQGGRGPRTLLLMLCHCPECPSTPSPDHWSPVLLQGPHWCHLFQEASDTHAHTRVHTCTRTHLHT